MRCAVSFWSYILERKHDPRHCMCILNIQQRLISNIKAEKINYTVKDGLTACVGKLIGLKLFFFFLSNSTHQTNYHWLNAEMFAKGFSLA